MVIETKQLISAFIGALIALLLKAGYDWFLERQKRVRLKKLIQSDIKRHLLTFNFIKNKIYKLTKDKDWKVQTLINNIEAIYSLNHNVAIFESNSYLDYHKAYNEAEFHKLVSVYFAIKRFYEMNPVTIIEKAREDLSAITEKNEEQVNDFVEYSNVGLSLWLQALEKTALVTIEFLKLTDKDYRD